MSAQLTPANGAVGTVVPLQSDKDKMEAMEKVTVTVIPGKEVAAILNQPTVKFIAQAFELQDAFSNPSDFQRAALEEASVLYLKTTCQRVIGTWDNLITKFSKTPRYNNVGRKEIEQSLRDNPKTRPYWELCKKAVAIKAQL